MRTMHQKTARLCSNHLLTRQILTSAFSASITLDNVELIHKRYLSKPGLAAHIEAFRTAKRSYKPRTSDDIGSRFALKRYGRNKCPDGKIHHCLCFKIVTIRCIPSCPCNNIKCSWRIDVLVDHYGDHISLLG